ncbi:hypothetical protein [Actinomadura verrucosospora]|uniref:TROVE domain-containing protein n=1 Tax=Actinomadura verrucosospora TaxID=46165 RepID=A0A7D3VW81_ACTVE|nr:hypothetical protein [Actinomadura verrucosospora]QKG20272.1 TROVE domain-containing protein [Actinomadura verrucosospora]
MKATVRDQEAWSARTSACGRSRPRSHQPAAGRFSGASPRLRDRRERRIEELFVTALTHIGFEDALFLWPEPERDRYDALLREATRAAPEWTAAFLAWLRTSTPMRYPALAGAAAFVRERLDTGRHGLSRQVVASVLRRADDPGHFLGHWLAAYGRPVPKPVKRGVADAVTRLYDDGALTYDTDGRHLSVPGFLHSALTLDGGVREARPLRFGDVVEMVRPRPRDERQAELFRHVIERRRGRAERRPPPDASWRREAATLRRRLGRDDWERLVPSMALPDLVGRLRRLDEAGIGFETAMRIAGRLSDPAEVRASGLLPVRLAAARDAVPHPRWRPVLERAATYGLGDLPAIPGRTLLVLDHMRADTAVFGLTLAQRCASADVVTFQGTPFEVVPGESPLHGYLRWQCLDLPHDGFAGVEAVPAAYRGHDRVVIVAGFDPGAPDVPGHVPVYTWQAAYSGRHFGSPPDRPRQTLLFEGLGDAALGAVPLIEDARRGVWPFSPASGTAAG